MATVRIGSRNVGSRWSIHHGIVFVLTFMGYAFFHATRKTFSNVKVILKAEWTPSFHNDSFNETKPDDTWNSHHLFESTKVAEDFLGVLDTVFMFAYAVGLYISGIVGDRLDMRKVLAFGMCGSALCVFLFGTVSEWLHLYSITYYIILWIINGLLQSTGWPAMVAVMGNWFGRSSRGLILGLWSACASVGNIIGTLMASSVLHYGYQYTFLVTSAALFGWGIVIFFALVPSPAELGMSIADSDRNSQPAPSQPGGHTEEAEPLLLDSTREDSGLDNSPKIRQEKAVGFFRAVLLPGVIPYSLAYACLKFVNYAFFFWLPLYLTSAYHWPTANADEISIWYDVGGIVAGVIGGVISDVIGVRAPIVVAMLALAAPSLYFYTWSPNNHLVNALLMSVVGFFIGGPASLISAAISADLGREGPIKGNDKAMATVTGIIDGSGSVGAGIGQVLIPIFHQKLGWHWVFYIFIMMTLCTLICILPVLVREVRNMQCWRSRFGQSGLTINTSNEDTYEGDTLAPDSTEPISI
ncbi:Sugar phosphate exchanger 3 [Lamellibrachia satsuma]|nr:Sugar phosphate exchanger 3 [Lamellibrachia satsuma]